MRHASSSNSSPASGSDAGIPIFERVLFFVLLAVLCARPLISESFERLELSFLAAMGVGAGTTPAATAWLDSVALTAAAAALARGWGRWRGGVWILLGVAVLAVAVGISFTAAGDKRLALNAGFNLLVGVLSAAALVQLMRAPWMPRLLLATMLATGCATATKCIIWKAIELDSTVEYWEEQKASLLEQGMDADDPTLINFERRLRSGEAIGYQSHPNVTGSFLMMWLLVAVGLCASRLVDRGGQPRPDRAVAIVLCVGMCLILAIGLWFTGSVGALVSLVVGLVLFLILGFFRRWCARRAGRATALLLVGYVTMIAAALGYGMSKGTLPHSSLAFRWHYWTAAAKAVREAPLTGLGRLNFSDAYLRHKAAAGTEEVRDPHSFWITLLVELGPLGLLAGGLLIGGCVYGALRRLDVAGEGDGTGQTITKGQLAASAIGVLLLHAVFSASIVSRPTALLWAVEFAGVWVLALLLTTGVVAHLPKATVGRGWLMAGLAAALLAALVHGLIGFALLTPGGLSVLVGLSACIFSLHGSARDGVVKPARIAPALVGMVLVSAHVVLVTLPTMRSGFWLLRMKAAQFDPRDRAACLTALEWGRKAIACDPIDVSAPREVAGFAAMLGSNQEIPTELRIELLEQARDCAQVALVRNARSCAAHVRLAQIFESLEDAYLGAARMDDSVRALQNAVAHWQAAVDLYPTDPRKRISAGQAWFQWWLETDNPEAARTAAGHFAAALRIDATRLPEEVQRLRPSELERLYHHLRELEADGYGVPATSAPAPSPPP